MTQFIKCRFRSADTKLFTYANEGPPLEVGDFVKVQPARGAEDSWVKVEVVLIDVEQPTFDCKPVLGKIEPDQGDLLVA